MSGLRPCLLIYDIPQRSGVTNPSARLRRIAVRVNLSCWVIPESRIPYHLLSDMGNGGAVWQVVRFDDSEAGKLVKMAQAAMQRELDAAIARVRRSEGNAAEQMQGAEVDPAIAARNYQTRMRAALRRVERRAEDFRAAAGVFGIDPNVINPLTAITAIKAGMEARAKAYVEAAQTAREQGQEWAAQAAQSDNLPVGVLADLVEENGGDVTALRDAFDNAPLF